MTIHYPQPANTTNPLASAKENPSLPKLYSIIDNMKFGAFYNTDVYYSFNNINFYHGGKNYSATTTVSFPDPDHDEGQAATGSVYLGLTAASLTITGGTEHQPGDHYMIYPSGSFEDGVTDKEPAIVKILSVNENDDNSVDKWTLISPGYGFSNDAPTVVPQFTSARANAFAATVTLNNDLYTIVDVKFTSYGTGYLKSPYPRYLSFDNAGSGTGARATVGSKSNAVLYTTKYIEDGEKDIDSINADPEPLYEFASSSSKKSILDYYAIFSSPVITHNDYE